MAGNGDDDYALAKRLLAEPATRADGLARLRHLAESGHARAQFRLGLLLARGEAGLAADPAAAARWCMAAAQQGLGKAQFNLALLRASDGPSAAAEAGRWLRMAAINGIDEAERCLDLVHGDDSRPTSWADAATRTSVALAPSGDGADKAVRFAEYYVDPCINVLVSHLQLSREQSEDIVQQFLLELEQPLSKGEHRGLAWKASLRQRFAAGRRTGQVRFRPYLYRVLVNFARDWLRDQRRDGDRRLRAEDAIDPALVADHHADEWRAALARFQTAGAGRPQTVRPLQALGLMLAEGLGQAGIAERLGLSDRTVRHDLRLAGELLIAWLEELLATPPLRADADLDAAMRLLPDWLHHPVGGKRLRILLFLALVERRLRRQGR